MKTLLDYYVSRCAVVAVTMIAAVLLIVTASNITLLGSYWTFIFAASTASPSIKRFVNKASVFPLQRLSGSVSHSPRIGDGGLGPPIVATSKGTYTIDDFVRFRVVAQRMPRPPIDSERPYRLLSCSSKNDKAGVLQELEKGVLPNLADYDKRTALHLASCEGCTEVVVLLLEKGANVNSIDRWGRTPLSDARSCGHEDICNILMARGGIDPVELNSQNPCYEIDSDEVDMEGAILIGEGAFGEVYRVKWRGTEVAAKTIRSSIASNPRVRSDFMKELALWQKLRHPNIVQFLGVLKQSDRLIFLTEYLRNGSLFDILRKRGRLDPQTAVAYALDIARGMNYLHQHKPHAIIHRDLTPRNVLQDESGHLKVTDFGLSKITLAKVAESYKMTGCTGSYRYMAPEVYRRESYGKSVDVFSFAMIVYEMFYGGPSSRTQTPEQVADKRAYEDYRPPLSSYVHPESVRVLLRECWHKNPDRRPKSEDIISELEKIQESMLYDKPMRVCCSCAIS